MSQKEAAREQWDTDRKTEKGGKVRPRRARRRSICFGPFGGLGEGQGPGLPYRNPITGCPWLQRIGSPNPQAERDTISPDLPHLVILCSSYPGFRILPFSLVLRPGKERVVGRAVRRVETPIGTFWGFRGDTVTEHLRRFGAHTRNELAMVLSFLRPGDVVLDAGAHIGTFAIPMGDRVGPRGRVYAFEGSAETFALLERNVAANDRHGVIEAHWAVVADRPGRFEPVTRRANSGATFFLEAGGGGRTAVPTDSGASGGQGACGPAVVVLDQWLPGRTERLDLIKIDVEGMEPRVLAGATVLLKRFRPLVYVEVNRDALARQGETAERLESQLGRLGYHFFRNAEMRNSASDRFLVRRLEHLADGGPMYDLLAVHVDSDRYPPGVPRFDAAAYRRLVQQRVPFAVRAMRRLRRCVMQCFA